MAKFACFAILALFIVEITATDYCSICPYHTMCIYPELGRKCSQRQYWGVLFSDKAKIINLHNEHRHFVAEGSERRGDSGPQPSAKNMASLVWDDELEEVAQRWANQCNFGHDTCRNVSRYKWVGQNVAISGSWHSHGVYDYTQDWQAVINSFYNEVAYFNNKNVDAFGTYPSSKATGHYTQLVWATTTRVGCGFVSFIQHRDGENWLMKYYVCNYAPGGNVLGEPVYERDSIHSQYSKGTRWILEPYVTFWLSCFINCAFQYFLPYLNLQWAS